MATEIKERHKCPPHHWIINSENVGHCKYCPAVRDFRKLQRREERLMEVKAELGRHSKRSKAIYGYGKRGRPPKYA